MSLTRDDVIRYLESLPGDELGKLADEVLRRVGAPPIALPPKPEVISMGVPLVDPEFDVRLRDPGPNKMAVIVAVRRLSEHPIGLHEAKELVERAPVVLFQDRSRSEAEDLVKQLRELGADVEVW